MNALGSSVMGDDDVQHGTKEGRAAGCRGSSCPSAAVGLSCSTAHRRYAGDWAFRKLVDRGLSPAEIVAAEGGVEVAERGERARRAVDRVVTRETSGRLVSEPIVERSEVAALRVPETWRISDGPAFEVAEKVATSCPTDCAPGSCAIDPCAVTTAVRYAVQFAPVEGGETIVTAIGPDGYVTPVDLPTVPESVVAGAVAAAVAADSPIRPNVSPRPFQGRSGAHSGSDVEQRRLAVELAALGARRMKAWAEIEEIRGPSNDLIVRLVGLGMEQKEIAELAGISQGSVSDLLKKTKGKGK